MRLRNPPVVLNTGGGLGCIDPSPLLPQRVIHLESYQVVTLGMIYPERGSIKNGSDNPFNCYLLILPNLIQVCHTPDLRLLKNFTLFKITKC